MEAESIQDNVPADTNTINDTNNKGIPLQRLIELRSKGLSYSEIGSLVNCSKVNVYNRLVDFKEDIESLKSFKDNRADLFAVYQSALINSINLNDIKKMPAASRVTAAAILYDKERLERDKSTSNVGIEAMVTHRQTLEEASKEAQERKEEALRAIAQLQSGKPSPAEDNGPE